MGLREDWPEGQEFRVVKDGAFLDGMVPTHPSAFSGWKYDLPVGAVITCLGYRRGWGSDPGPDIVQWSCHESKRVHASFVEFRPQGGKTIYDSRPMDGYLEKVEAQVVSE